jgi:hypothetical protein
MEYNNVDDVSIRHPLLDDNLDKIIRSRDAFRGSDSVKEERSSFYNIGGDEAYLPRLGGQDKIDYDNYKNRAVFYGVMARTVSALVGSINRKPPIITNEESLKDFLADVTGNGMNFYEFIKDIEKEIMISGRVIVCVDRKNNLDNKPYLVWYKNEDCINWFTDSYSESSSHNLSGAVFKEEYFDIDKSNRFKQISKIQYREFSKVDGNVEVNIWRNDSDGESNKRSKYEIHESYTLTNRGKELGFVPCVSIVSEGSSYGIPKPPLLDLVNINMAHYRNSADYEHGMHWTALPTPWFSGLNDRDANITIGSGSAIILPDPSAKAGFLEFSGAGLSKISEAMRHKEEMMSSLGARMLSTRMDQSTSAEVARMNISGEVASLSNMAKSMSLGLTRLLQLVGEWENKNVDGIRVDLNEDYVDTKLSAEDLSSLLSAYQSGVISLDSLLWNLDQGERLPIGRTVEEEMQLIEAGIEKDTQDWADQEVVKEKEHEVY